MNQARNRSRRRGIAIVYVIVGMTAFLGIVSLAVDLGRVEVAKTELRRAADSASRAAVIALPQGTSAAQTAAITMAGDNTCDGSSVALTNSNVSIGIWNKSTKSFSTSGSADNITTFTAVQVSASRTRAGGNPIPLLFGAILGVSTCDVHATSVAAMVPVSAPLTQFVSAHGDPWLAGEPLNTLGSVPDNGYNNPSTNVHPWKNDIANPGVTDTSSTIYSDSTKVASTDYQNHEPWGSPTPYSVTPGSVIQISVPIDSNNMSGNDGYLTSGSGSYTADGSNNGTYNIYSDDAANPSLPQGTQTTAGSEHGISNIEAPLNSMIGVFLDQTSSTNGADTETAPSGLDYSTQSARDYLSVEPKLNQSFFVGNGSTSSTVQQTIIVPNNAYELFLGTMDGHEWSNNVGGFNATITQYKVELVQ
jgi:Flp pilus assembly protein TadG